MDASGLGGEFRALRVAAGRTVASVAVDAGLSVPYIANLENGRGNPTIGALSRLAAAFGRRLVVGLSGDSASEPAGERRGPLPQADNSKKPAAAIPPSLIRFARTQRFRSTVAAMAAMTGQGDSTASRDGAELAGRLVAGLAGLAGAVDRDLGETDWARFLDALFLVTIDPVERGPDDVIYVASRLSATLSTFPLVSLGSSAGNLKCAGTLNAASRSRQ
jgi:transcriptional regulator with XRE-family HTH domain